MLLIIPLCFCQPLSLVTDFLSRPFVCCLKGQFLCVCIHISKYAYTNILIHTHKYVYVYVHKFKYFSNPQLIVCSLCFFLMNECFELVLLSLELLEGMHTYLAALQNIAKTLLITTIVSPPLACCLLAEWVCPHLLLF